MKQSIYASTKELNQQFAARIASILENAIQSRGVASLIVSGGRTPQEFFAQLSQRDLDWPKVTISLADERWVDVDDAASNEKMVREHLLVNKAASARFVGLKNAQQSAEQGVDACCQAVNSIPAPFDVVILGMGEDGHTASLFPCSAQITAGLDLKYPKSCLAVQPTTAPHWRMSLSLAKLLDANHHFLHLTGDSKKAVLEKALAGDDELEMPIRAVLSRADVELIWAP
ncbi:6-phosphogluconolactonase [Aliiglaciecola sp. CAU 1673]|uniref:6-phosphogluconolactonase n=1 Tax=Aliiglaciecola sp. CAU 1673 TaxID=3032595 RepID=UPI0023DADCEE|nr:6-phosphogluconolactonase [Aliiglaciecola sp. CAU 1673]MDF2178767.1 6-phosphogluconolactonase [Aliiglaciecola sp. CAU 1673]